MILRSLSIHLLLIAVVAGTAASASAAPPDKEVKKTLKTLITAIRYGKYDLAAKQLDFAAMVNGLLGDHEVSDAERKEMVAGFESIIRKTSFVKGNEMFEHLDAVLYDKTRQEDGATRCKSTVVIHRNYKKTELVIDWVLKKNGSAWKVYDIVMLGESTLEGIREDQVDPLLEEGGTEALMGAMRDKLKELQAE
jgi:ABC-type transporter MlaC component